MSGDVLFPDAEVTLAGPDGAARTVTVRAFRAREALQAQGVAAPLVAALAATGVDGGAIEPAAVDAVLADHADAWIELLARASGLEAEELGALPDGQFQDLSDAMWDANGRFFIRRVMAHAAARTPSPASSPDSSGPGTDPSS